jgi:hypothetical protein
VIAPEQFYDLSFEQLDDGTIRLEQKDYCGGEAYIIDLHPCQLRHIAERADILRCGDDGTAARRFNAVAERLFRLAGDTYYRGEIIERCGMGSEFLTELDAVCDLADEFLRDLGTRASLPAPDAGLLVSNENSPPISVTPSETAKRGRPATGEAMTNAERQKAHREREKQRDLLDDAIAEPLHHAMPVSAAGLSESLHGEIN